MWKPIIFSKDQSEVLKQDFVEQFNGHDKLEALLFISGPLPTVNKGISGLALHTHTRPKACSVTLTLLIMKTTEGAISFLLSVLVRLVGSTRSPHVCLISLPLPPLLGISLTS